MRLTKILPIVVLLLASFGAQAVPVRTLELPPAKGNPRNSEGAFVTLKDGRILFVYTHFTGGRGDHAAAHLAGRYSSDQGRSWTTQDRVIVPNEGGMNVMSVTLLRLQSGKIALFYALKNSEQDCRPVLRLSADEGETWSAPLFCVEDQIGYYVVNNDRVIQLANGRLVLPVCLHWPKGDPKADWQGELMCYLSDDNGATWRRGKTAQKGYDKDGKRITTQEPGVVELKDGRVMMFIRASGGCQYLAWSSDGGDTWSAPVASELKSPLSPASIKRLPLTGDLLLVWNNHEGIDPALARRRVPLSTAISRDDGKSWQHSKVLEGNPKGHYCYIAIHPVDDAVLLGYCAMSGLAHSRVTRVPVSWLYQEAPAVAAIKRSVPLMFDGAPKKDPLQRWESVRGVWSAEPGHAEFGVYPRSKGIRILGGEKRTVILNLRQALSCGQVLAEMGVERFTARAPYQLKIEAHTAKGWQTIWEQGDATPVGQPWKIEVREAELKTSRIRFQCSSALGAVITDMPMFELHGYFQD